MLPCMPAFALKRYAEVTAGREVFQECFGKHTLCFAHHNVPNVEVSRWYEDEPGQTLDFDRPRENIGLKHPDDSSVWCVVRAGHEISVVYDAKKNAVTFLNMKGVFSLRHASPQLAKWAAAAERVLPFTGTWLLRSISNAFYLPLPTSQRSAGRKAQAVERDDDEYELVVTGGASGGGAVDDQPDAWSALDSAQNKSLAPGSSRPPALFELFEPRRESNGIASPSVSSAAGKRVGAMKFDIERAKVVFEGGGSIRDIVPSCDGKSDEELLELHFTDTRVTVVKVRSVLPQRNVALDPHAATNFACANSANRKPDTVMMQPSCT
jgi:hypothetical protein